ncbi:hypothetical protein NPIL_318161 [Nephila pilipes]|uniref:Uncharacterized protein n=1 Tax=Nephila pilipes TaxID=299642 RepID=A0A8X6N9Q3_NEPPI|nr:hypothetical protein NPIL_318161 [Nephila pilipes]
MHEIASTLSISYGLTHQIIYGSSDIIKFVHGECQESKMKFELLEHSTYSPDPAPPYIHFFWTTQGCFALSPTCFRLRCAKCSEECVAC